MCIAECRFVPSETWVLDSWHNVPTSKAVLNLKVALMRNPRLRKSFAFLLSTLCGVTLAQSKPDTRNLVVNGKSAESALMQINNRIYVDLETLARLANGTLSYRANLISLQLGCSSAGDSTPVAEQSQSVPQTGLSRHFVSAAIETIAQLREWGSTMAYAIQNGYGITAGWAAGYREKAASSLRLASSAASTDSDQNALQLLTNEFNNVGVWSDKLVQAKQSMDTAKYSMSPNALRDDPLSQKIITCGHFLGAMLGSGEYKDDPSCH